MINNKIAYSIKTFNIFINVSKCEEKNLKIIKISLNSLTFLTKNVFLIILNKLYN